MAIVVNPIGRIFRVVIECEGEKLSFDFKQLDYKTKSRITSLITQSHQGQVTVDAHLQVFFNLKHGLKGVEGLEDEEGKPYVLEFEDKQKSCLTDNCVDALLATVFSDELQYTARELSYAVMPTDIRHPLTGEPLPGIEVIPPEQLKGIRKKS